MKLREQELIKKVQKQNGLEKQEQMHLEQIKKHEHNLAQQLLMLDDVQLKLEAVRDEVHALRAMVSEKKEPTGPSVRPPSPCPREPPPDDDEDPGPVQDRMSNGVDLNVAATPIDVDADMEEDDEEWQTILPKSKKQKVLSSAF